MPNLQKGQTVISIVVSEELKRQLKLYCFNKGVTLQQLLKPLILDGLERTGVAKRKQAVQSFSSPSHEEKEEII